ncbi:MAG: polysaccharide lyase 6 family protein [Mangrovibacterium sp.]
MFLTKKETRSKSLVILYVIICFLLVACVQKGQSVKTTGELQDAISTVQPGDVIYLEDGVFDGTEIHVAAKGSAGKPVVIQARNTGKAIFSVPLKIEGEFISVAGISFKDKGKIELSGKNCKVSRCTWSDVKNSKNWIQVLAGSSEIEISHNLFENKTNNREREKGCQVLRIIVRNENERHHVHHNLFRDIPEGKTENSYETIQLITENNPFDPPGGHCNTVIEDNLFVRCNGEREIISVKSNGNIIRRNTFLTSWGSLVLRHGDDNVAVGNFFFGDGEKSGGIRLQGTGQIVAGNYFYGLGELAVGMMDGTPDDLYIRTERAQILFNSFINCQKNLVVGLNHALYPNGTVPKDCEIAGNLFYFNGADAPENFIEYVQGDQPENWVWKDNVAFGAPVLSDIPGIRTENPQLVFRENGWAFPTAETPESEYPLAETVKDRFDLAGIEWKEKRTVGAILFPSDLKNIGFLTEEMVGPYAK